MSELLKLIAWAQTAASAKYLPRITAWVLSAIVLGILWFSESSVMRSFGFVGVDVAIYMGLFFFVQSPVEWAKILFVKLIFTILGASRLIIKVVLICVSLLLSAVYVISPCDIIPDILLGLGQLDDILITIGLVSYAANSKYSLPVPTMSAEDAADLPFWKVVLLATMSTVITWFLRIVTS